MPVYWDEFSWEAFATITTGLAAVAAASVVGIRQVRLAERQSAILDKQAVLQTLTLRSQLYDRRFTVFDATRTFVLANLPLSNDLNMPEAKGYLECAVQAQFLFSNEVAARLREIYAARISFISKRLEGKEWFDDYTKWQFDTLEELGILFGKELNLSSLADVPVRRGTQS